MRVQHSGVRSSSKARCFVLPRWQNGLSGGRSLLGEWVLIGCEFTLAGAEVELQYSEFPCAVCISISFTIGRYMSI